MFEIIGSNLLSSLYRFAAACAVVYFLYGAGMYIVDMNNPEKKTFGRSHLLWGMVGLIIIFSIGGIINILNDIVSSSIK